MGGRPGCVAAEGDDSRGRGGGAGGAGTRETPLEGQACCRRKGAHPFGKEGEPRERLRPRSQLRPRAAELKGRAQARWQRGQAGKRRRQGTRGVPEGAVLQRQVGLRVQPAGEIKNHGAENRVLF